MKVAPILVGYSSLLSIVSYICCLVNFDGNTAKKIGLYSLSGSSAFYSLLLKTLFTIPFYIMRYYDGVFSESPETTSRREVPHAEYSAAQWIAPFICLFTCILYICLRYLFQLQFGEWSALTENQWISEETISLTEMLWLPIIFIIFIIFVHLRRLEHPFEAAWSPNSILSKVFATYCDAVISVLLSIFAALNISVIGLILLLLAFIIFVATPKTRGIACCTACVLLAILWMLSFLATTLTVPVLVYPKNCTNVFRLDHNTLQWLGISSQQLWTIIVLLFLLSSRCAFYVENSVWLPDVNRINAENGISSTMKYLVKFWMHKFGFEVRV